MDSDMRIFLICAEGITQVEILMWIIANII